MTDRRTLVNLPPCDRIVVCVGYRHRGGSGNEPRDNEPRDGRFTLHRDGVIHLTQHLKTHHSSRLPHLVLISTTGVYHQTGGVWVDERSPTRPTRDGARAHLDGEVALRRHYPADRSTVLRLSGIYGPGRVPRRDVITSGRPIVADRDSWLNLIHVDDAAAAVIAAWSGECCGLFCVSDDTPIRRGAFYDAVARSIGRDAAEIVPPSRSTGAGLSQRARSTADRRVCNRKMKRGLLGRLRYPDAAAAVGRME